MHLENKEPNYSATVIRVNTLTPLAGRDRIVGLPAFGSQAIVSAQTEIGQIGILFTAETQLSERYCHVNDLFDDSSLNATPTAKGYFKENRRVRAVRFAGHRSDAFFMPLSSLNYLDIDTNQLKVGDSFTHINGVEICRKYAVPRKPNNGGSNKQQVAQLRKNRVESKLIPEHYDSTHWDKVAHTIGDKQWLIVTQKLHGTSVRLANQLCSRELTYWEKWAEWFGINVQRTEYDYFACSRRVIKDLKRKDAGTMQHFYSVDLYNRAMDKYYQVIPRNWIIYGELIGWDNDGWIQENYTYNVPKGMFDLYVYRIAVVNPDGVSVDLAWGQVKEFCKSADLKYAPEIWQGEKKDFHPQVYMDKKYYESGLTQCVPLAPESPCDEGVVVRVNGLRPQFLKAKAPLFVAHETGQLDKGVIDKETEESIVEE